jgi:uncharacterized protein (TIGR00299 family) protein
MRIAYLECFSGISGDMMLGALLHTGVSEELLKRTVASLNIGAQLHIGRVDRSGISATKVDVLMSPRAEHSHDHQLESHSHAHDHPHQHSHAHDDHPHSHQHHEATHEGQHQHGRSLSAIREIIANSGIPESAHNTAIRAFELLGEAESGIHKVPIESIHFHEVGAVDAIVDIVCAAVGCHALGVDGFVCSPLNVGGGTVKCAHGEFPVPAPATLALLKDAPVYSSGVKAELVTPTGAALIRALDCRFSDFPKMKVEQIGYGAGTRNPSGNPNVLRISVGELMEAEQYSSKSEAYETVTVLETTIDDLTPQVMGYVTERLLAEGAFDVFVTPAQMKKNRPGSLLSVLCDQQNAQRMREIMFTETTTIGIRTRQERRDCLRREIVPVATQWGMVRIKESSFNGAVTNFSPEYDDCRQIAEANGVPLKQVQQETIAEYLEQRKRDAGDAIRSRSTHSHTKSQVA